MFCDVHLPKTITEGVLIYTTSSFLFWLSLHCVLVPIRKKHEFSNWIVSSTHAIVATFVGLKIVQLTRHDLIHAKCNLAELFAYPLAGYFLQDTLILILIQWQQTSNLK